VARRLREKIEQLQATVKAAAEAGATHVTPLTLHLRPGVKEEFMPWLAENHPELWLRFMSREELGLAEETFDPPVRIAAVTGFAYLAGALITLVPYFLRPTPQPTFAVSATLAVATLLATGAAKTWLTKENPLAASLELAGLGVLACIVGLVLGRLVGIAV